MVFTYVKSFLLDKLILNNDLIQLLAQFNGLFVAEPLIDAGSLHFLSKCADLG